MIEAIDKSIEVVKGRIPSLGVHSDMQKAGQAVLHLMHAKALQASLPASLDEFDEQIAFMLGRVRSNLGATELVQVTQGVLHLMNAKALCESLQQPAKTTKAKTT